MVSILQYVIRCAPPVVISIIIIVLISWFISRRTLTPIRQRSPWIVIAVNITCIWPLIIDALLPIIMHTDTDDDDSSDSDSDGNNNDTWYSCWWESWIWVAPWIIALSLYIYRMINFMFAAAHAHHQMAIANEPSDAAHRRIAHPSCMVRYRRCQSSVTLASLVICVALGWIIADIMMLLHVSTPCPLPGSSWPYSDMGPIGIAFYIMILLYIVIRFRLDDSFHIRVELTLLFMVHITCGGGIIACLQLLSRPSIWRLDGHIEYVTLIAWFMVLSSSLLTLAWPLMQSYRMARVHKQTGGGIWNVPVNQHQLPPHPSSPKDDLGNGNGNGHTMGGTAGPWYTIRDLASLLAIEEGMRSFRTFLVSEMAVETLHFWVAVNEYVEMASGRVSVTGGAVQVAREAVNIYNKFIVAGSEYQIALPAPLVARIKTSLAPHMRSRTSLPIPSAMLSPRDSVIPVGSTTPMTIATTPSTVLGSPSSQVSSPPRRAFGTFNSNTHTINNGNGNGSKNASSHTRDTSDLVRMMTSTLPPVSPDLFLDAQRIVYNTMAKDIWPRYIRSQLFADLLSLTLAMPPPGTTHSAMILAGRPPHQRKRSEPYNSDHKSPPFGHKDINQVQMTNVPGPTAMNGHPTFTSDIHTDATLRAAIAAGRHHSPNYGHHLHRGSIGHNNGHGGHHTGAMMSMQSSTSSPSVTEIGMSPPGSARQQRAPLTASSPPGMMRTSVNVPPIVGMAQLVAAASSSSPSGASVGSLAASTVPLTNNGHHGHNNSALPPLPPSSPPHTITQAALPVGPLSPLSPSSPHPLRSGGGTTMNHFASRSPSPRVIASATAAINRASGHGHGLGSMSDNDFTSRHMRSTSGGMASDHNHSHNHKRSLRRAHNNNNPTSASGQRSTGLSSPTATITTMSDGPHSRLLSQPASMARSPPPMITIPVVQSTPAPLSPLAMEHTNASSNGNGHGGIGHENSGGRLFQAALDVGLIREDMDPEPSPDHAPFNDHALIRTSSAVSIPIAAAVSPTRNNNNTNNAFQSNSNNTTINISNPILANSYTVNTLTNTRPSTSTSSSIPSLPLSSSTITNNIPTINTSNVVPMPHAPAPPLSSLSSSSRVSSPPRSPLEQSLAPSIPSTTLDHRNQRGSTIATATPPSSINRANAGVREHATAALFNAMGLDDYGGQDQSVAAVYASPPIAPRSVAAGVNRTNTNTSNHSNHSHHHHHHHSNSHTNHNLHIPSHMDMVLSPLPSDDTTPNHDDDHGDDGQHNDHDGHNAGNDNTAVMAALPFEARSTPTPSPPRSNVPSPTHHHHQPSLPIDDDHYVIPIIPTGVTIPISQGHDDYDMHDDDTHNRSDIGLFDTVGLVHQNSLSSYQHNRSHA